MQRSILVIDDDEDDCRIIKESLLQVGIRFPIHITMDGEQALGLLKEMKTNLPSLVILDLNMPGMNGMQVLEFINSEFGIPVILYTTSCDDATVIKAKGMGAVDCIKKGTSYSDNLKFAKYVADLMRSFRPEPIS